MIKRLFLILLCMKIYQLRCVQMIKQCTQETMQTSATSLRALLTAIEVSLIVVLRG